MRLRGYMNMFSDLDPGGPDHTPKVTVPLAGGFGITLAPLISIAVAAWALTLHPQTVKRLIRRGELAAHKIGDGRRARYRVVSESMGVYLQKNVVGPDDLDDDDDDLGEEL